MVGPAIVIQVAEQTPRLTLLVLSLPDLSDEKKNLWLSADSADSTDGQGTGDPTCSIFHLRHAGGMMGCPLTIQE